MSEEKEQLDQIEQEKQVEQKVQSRTFSIMLYPDAENYNFDEALANCCEYFLDWAYIKHDKDALEDGSLKKEHYHVVGRLKGSRTPQIVANRIGIPANYVECKKGYTFKKGVRYLLHLDHPKKAQYDAEDISSSGDISVYINSYSETSVARMIFDIASRECIDDVRVLGFRTFEEGLYSEFRRNYGFWRDVCRLNKEEFN